MSESLVYIAGEFSHSLGRQEPGRWKSDLGRIQSTRTGQQRPQRSARGSNSIMNRWAMTKKCCNLHGTELIEDSVPILYGTFAPEPTDLQTERNRIFPFANAFMSGPCSVGVETQAMVRFCPTCRDYWLGTPEGVQFAEYLAQERPTTEQDIERLRAQQIGNARYERNLKLVRLVCYSVFGAAISSFISYHLNSSIALGMFIGGICGAIGGVFSNRRVA